MRKVYALAMLMFIALSHTASSSLYNARQMQVAATGVSLTIDFGNGTILSFNGLSGETVLNVTRSVVDVQIDWFGDLAFVTAIGGVGNDADNDRWWQYWVNGEYASIACNKFWLNDNDSVIWRRQGSVITRTGPDGDDPTLLIGALVIGLVGVISVIILFKRGAR